MEHKLTSQTTEVIPVPGATVNFTPLCLSFPGYKMVIKESQKCFVLKQTSAQNSTGKAC